MLLRPIEESGVAILEVHERTVVHFLVDKDTDYEEGLAHFHCRNSRHLRRYALVLNTWKEPSCNSAFTWQASAGAPTPAAMGATLADVASAAEELWAFGLVSWITSSN